MKISTGKIFVFAALCFIVFLCSGCFTIEHEIFLKDDGSGTFIMHITMPNPPKKEGEPVKPDEDPKQIMKDIKESMDKLNVKGLTLKDVKLIEKNDLAQIYIMSEFQDIKTLVPALKQLSEAGNKNSQKKGENEEMDMDWKVDLKKDNGKTAFTSSYTFAFKPEKKEEKKTKTKEDEEWGKMAEDMLTTMLSMAKVRFVIHAPKDFTQTNADMTFGSQAVWESALSSFIGKSPKPLEMEASY